MEVTDAHGCNKCLPEQPKENASLFFMLFVLIALCLTIHSLTYLCTNCFINMYVCESSHVST